MKFVGENVFLIYNIRGIYSTSCLLLVKLFYAARSNEEEKGLCSQSLFTVCRSCDGAEVLLIVPREQTLTGICKVTILLKTITSLSLNSCSCLYTERFLHSASSFWNCKAPTRSFALVPWELCIIDVRTFHMRVSREMKINAHYETWNVTRSLLIKCYWLHIVYSMWYIQTVCSCDVIMEWKSNIRRTQSLKSFHSSCDKPVWSDVGLREKMTSVSQLVAR